MKLCLITDEHFGARSDNLAIHSYFKKFYDNVFFPYLEENAITHVIDLGDTVDRRKYINFLTLKLAKDYFFDKLEEKNIQHHLIVGNHSTYYKNSNDVNSSNLLFSRYKNITVYEKATEVEIDGCKILYIPWICQENEEESFQTIAATDAQIAFGHLQISGFEMYRGSVIDTGHDMSLFSKFDVCASGHFHHKSSKGNIHYLGTPYEITWNDYGDRKGFHVFDTETRELTFIENPYKLFHKIEYDDTYLNAEELQMYDFEDMRETYIKLIVKNKTNPYFFDIFLDKIEAVEPINLQIIEEKSLLESEDEIIDEAKSTLDILTDVVNGIDGFDEKTRLVDLFRELYNEALKN